ncbi:hypothetical protein K2Z84_01940 [Candidatus Binatia bacterium]|nr:hypothetical protein [Candidatus Binatia bacterium]
MTATADALARGAAPAGERLAATLAWLALWTGFAWCIGLGTWGHWYSRSLAHRLQTDALLRGTFALQDAPYGQMADWAWGNGSQHVWGLGPALWRLPFEAAARIAGAPGFPDRVALLLAFVAASLACARPFRDVRPLERFVLAAVMVAPPAFVTLCRTRLAVYEESVAYAHLVAVTLAALLLSFTVRHRERDLFAACVLAGIAPLFRPTLLFAAGITVALGCCACLLASPRRSTAARFRTIAIAAAAFAGGLALDAAIGVARFGSPFETGQLLNVSYIPADQAAKLFGYPFRAQPFAVAAAELLSSLVLPASWNTPRWYATGIHPWQAPVVRFREFYFVPFTVPQLVLLAAAWTATASVAIGALRNARLRAWIESPVGVATAWSAAVAGCLTVFYLWAPSMTSRYAVDFAAPFGVAASALLLMLLRAVRARAPSEQSPQLCAALAGAVLLWLGYDAVATEIAPSHRATPLLDAAELVVAGRRPLPEPRPLPASYRCGDAPESTGVKFNGSGWATPGGCEVHAATMLFLPALEGGCVRVRIAPLPGAATLGAEQTSMVRAKLGLSELERRVDAADGDGRALTFCVPRSHRSNPRGIELLYLGWVRPADLSPDARPFRLLAVEEVAAP